MELKYKINKLMFVYLNIQETKNSRNSKMLAIVNKVKTTLYKLCFVLFSFQILLAR